MSSLETRTAPVVELRDVSLSRDSGFRLDVPHLRVEPGQTVALLGPSGAGKSSLLSAILGLAPAFVGLTVEGSRSILGESAPSVSRGGWRRRLLADVGFVPQDARSALDPLRRVGEQIAALAGGVPESAVVDAMLRLGVESPTALVRRPPHQISGGQAQRALLALALLRRPPLLVLDEPTAGLDRARIVELIREIDALRQVRPDAAVLVASHLPWFVSALGATAHSIDEGVLREGLPDLDAWPRREGRDERSGDVIVEGRKVGVRRGGHWIVDAVDLELRAGESVALLGPSGSGKTTLARVLAGHVRPDAGRVDRPRPRSAVQLVFQDAAGSLTPHRSVRSLCREAGQAAVDVASMASAIGLGADELDALPRELSGGQQRRAAVLRAMCAQPRALLLDEPTAGLDSGTARQVVDSLSAWLRDCGATSLWITHDDELAESVAQRVVTMEEGRLT